MRTGQVRGAVVVLLVLASACGKERPAGAPRETASAGGDTRVPAVAEAARPGRRVLFVGLDAADWQLLDGYMADGTMPNLAALAGQGASGVLVTIHPPLSPLVWTTMMTGVSPLEHRILDFTRFAPASGAREPIPSCERRVPAVWNMASWAGRGVAVFGLWATWPAERVRGLLVADRFSSFTAPDRLPPPGTVWPAERAAWATGVLQRAEAQTGLPALRRYLPWLTESEYARLAGAPQPYAHPVTALQRILSETRAYDELARGWLAAARPAPDLTVLYFQGPDTIGHIFAPYAPPRQEAVSAADFARYSQVPRLYFAEVDRLLGGYRRIAERSGAVLMIASDHGFRWKEGRPAQLSSAAAATAARWHRDEGIYLFWDPRAAGGHAGDAGGAPAAGRDKSPPPPFGVRRADARGGVAQVCATLLSLLGLPPGKGLAGPPLPGSPSVGAPRGVDTTTRPPRRGGPGLAPAGAGQATAAIDYQAFYRPAPEPAATAAASAASGGSVASAAGAAGEELAQLRALGYVGANEPATAAPGQGPAGSPAAERSRTAASFNNEGLLLLGEQRDAEARRAFERALGRDPDLASALANLSDLLAAPGAGPADADRADDLLVRALAGGVPDGVERILARAASYGRASAAERSLRLLAAAAAARPEEARLWLLHGRYLLERQRCDDALADFTRTVRLSPGDPLAHASLGLACLCRGDAAGARRAFRRSLELDPHQPELQRFLAPGR
ncbi:MAG TPA: alkaline phosphatase family protein [Thermoanaerobaculia bacterium]|nr:alkaline phosphatase family protein [Thermoanaerobaculia bacterium]